jgi:hypothetical protein
MRFRITVALLFLATALPAAPANISLLNTVVQGERTEYLIDIETLKGTPDWGPDKKEPPLAVSEACRIAVEAGRRRFPKADNISIQSVTLRSTEYHSGPSPTGPPDIVRWHYEVGILPIVSGETDYSASGSFIVILMDGSIIAPTRSKA